MKERKKERFTSNSDWQREMKRMTDRIRETIKSQRKKKIEHTDRGRRQAAGDCSFAREREGEGGGKEVGLDDIMCCYSPAEACQEDF